MRGRLAGAVLALVAAAGPSLADAPGVSATGVSATGVSATGVAATGVVITGAGPEHVLTGAELAALPVVQVTVAAEPGHGPPHRSFEGPLLWTVLQRAHAIDATKVREQVRQTVLLTGRDGYTAILALGELSPEFEGKQVILAERIDGEPLGPEHLRIVVPGDRRGGRGVHDLVGIAVSAAMPRAARP